MLNFVKKYIRSPQTRNFAYKGCESVGIYKKNLNRTQEMNKDRLEKGIRTREPMMLHYFLRSFCKIQKMDYRPYKACLHQVSFGLDNIQTKTNKKNTVKIFTKKNTN